MIRVLIVASSPVARAGLETVLRADPALEVLPGYSAASGMAIADSQADVVLAELENRSDENAAIFLEEAAAGTPVVFLIHGALSDWTGAIREGVRGVLPATATASQIAAAVVAAAVGLTVLSPTEMESQIPPQPKEKDLEALPESLTPRETEVLQLLADGLGNKQIAARLQLSEHTVKFHVASIFGKLGAASRTEAVTLGIRRGLVLI